MATIIRVSGIVETLFGIRGVHSEVRKQLQSLVSQTGLKNATAVELPRDGDARKFLVAEDR